MERLRGTGASRPDGLGASWDSLVLNNDRSWHLGRAAEEPFSRRASRAGCRNHGYPPPPFMREKDFKMATAER